MIKTSAKSVTSFFVENSIIEKGQEEIYEYGMEQIISNLITICSVLFLSILFSSFIETVIFLTVIVVVRRYTGGYHAESYRMCFLTFLLTYIGAMLVIKIIPMHFQAAIGIGLITLSMIPVFMYAPIINENNPKNDGEIRKLRKVSIKLAVIHELLIVLGFMALNMKYHQYVLSAAISMFIIAILIMVTKTNQKKKEDVL